MSVKRRSGGQAALSVALLSFLVASFLLTPASGIETRPVSKVTALGAASLGVFFAGVILAVISLVRLLRGDKTVATTTIAMIAVLLFFPGLIADRTGNLSKVRAPTAIFWLEWVETLFAASVIFFSIRLRRERNSSSAVSSQG